MYHVEFRHRAHCSSSRVALFGLSVEWRRSSSRPGLAEFRMRPTLTTSPTTTHPYRNRSAISPSYVSTLPDWLHTSKVEEDDREDGAELTASVVFGIQGDLLHLRPSFTRSHLDSPCSSVPARVVGLNFARDNHVCEPTRLLPSHRQFPSPESSTRRVDLGLVVSVGRRPSLPPHLNLPYTAPRARRPPDDRVSAARVCCGP